MQRTHQVIYSANPDIIALDPMFDRQERDDVETLGKTVGTLKRREMLDAAADVRSARRKMIYTAFHRTYPRSFTTLTKDDLQAWYEYLPDLARGSQLQSSSWQKQNPMPGDIIDLLARCRNVFEDIFVLTDEGRKIEYALFGTLDKGEHTVLIARWAPAGLSLPTVASMRGIARARDLWSFDRYAGRSAALGFLAGAASLFYIDPGNTPVMRWMSQELGTNPSLLWCLAIMALGFVVSVSGVIVRNKIVRKRFLRHEPQFAWAVEPEAVEASD